MSRFGRPDKYHALLGIVRLAVLGAVAGPLLLLKKIPWNNLWLNKIFGNEIVYFSILFYMFGVCDWICLKLKLYKEI